MCMSIRKNILEIKGGLPSSVELVAVSKFHPVGDIMLAYEAGQRAFGESRPQEFASKVAAMHEWLSSKGLEDDIRWHFIGHLQTNKLKMVLPYASLVQSVDSLHLLEEIEKWGSVNGKVTDVLLECHIAAETTKQGFAPEDILTLMTADTEWPHVHFCGLMGMATFTDDMNVVRSDFGRLTALGAALKTMIGTCPNLTEDFRIFSFGMSEDYGIAVEMGSNMVRIGTGIFGERNC